MDHGHVKMMVWYSGSLVVFWSCYSFRYRYCNISQSCSSKIWPLYDCNAPSCSRGDMSQLYSYINQKLNMIAELSVA
ncbi:hypothetical protein QVD17_06517 [Tagetes erecta]|uniref:Uncharacterized protein n=1 Tax=Tagetes erecta TaxID=13708 RepID=A0AAD8PBC5_TARER|nr:hypothetical protein QVD17_06517 [Tagetes erecta]